MSNDRKLDLLISILDYAVVWKDEELIKAVTNSILKHTVHTSSVPRSNSFNPDDTTRTED